jgi:hypothetical protein
MKPCRMPPRWIEWAWFHRNLLGLAEKPSRVRRVARPSMPCAPDMSLYLAGNFTSFAITTAAVRHSCRASLRLVTPPGLHPPRSAR